jgi:hypothetical protein
VALLVRLETLPVLCVAHPFRISENPGLQSCRR